MVNKYDTYQTLAKRTCATKEKDQTIAMCMIGIVNELGEFYEAIESTALYSSKLPNKEPLEDEIGDILWYIAVLGDACGIQFKNAMKFIPPSLHHNYTIPFQDEAFKAGRAIGKTFGPLKKYLYHKHDFPDITLLEDGITEITYCIAILAILCSIELDEVLDKNIKKLQERYPDGFSSERSINRKR